MKLLVQVCDGAEHVLSYNFVEHHFTFQVNWPGQRPVINLAYCNRLLSTATMFHHDKNAIAWTKLEIIDLKELCNGLLINGSPFIADDVINSVLSFVCKLEIDSHAGKLMFPPCIH